MESALVALPMLFAAIKAGAVSPIGKKIVKPL
jgi:hypothetical protein